MAPLARSAPPTRKLSGAIREEELLVAVWKGDGLFRLSLAEALIRVLKRHELGGRVEVVGMAEGSRPAWHTLPLGWVTPLSSWLALTAECALTGQLDAKSRR
jgi:hypothetical protein